MQIQKENIVQNTCIVLEDTFLKGAKKESSLA